VFENTIKNDTVTSLTPGSAFVDIFRRTHKTTRRMKWN